ncbi:MAG TPA: sigma-70 family RNA polymerase sigma factor [Cyclobacteriaceae bacterium]|nr:sigma-70 family RNA polymerase sigma factor [Cyclobacteriaceae bacterium]
MLLKSETDYLTAHGAPETSGFDQGLPEEEEVWREFKKGSKLAYSRIYRRYVNVLYNYGFKFIRDKSLVEDCIQDLFVELWESKARLSDTCSIKFYLMKALRIKIFRALKKQGPSGKIDPLLSYDFHITSSYEDELVRLQLHQEQNEKIKHAFSKLPVRQKEAVFLRYFDSLSFEEVAGVMAINPQSVHNLIHKAIKTLREHLVLEFTLLILVNPFP